MSIQKNIDPISGNVIGAKKQTSWFSTDVDFENSFKFWFALMWQNKYIQLFFVGLVPTILELCNITWVSNTISDNFADGVAGGIMTILGLLTPIAITSVIVYKGFYQFWKDIKSGTSR